MPDLRLPRPHHHRGPATARHLRRLPTGNRRSRPGLRPRNALERAAGGLAPYRPPQGLPVAPTSWGNRSSPIPRTGKPPGDGVGLASLHPKGKLGVPFEVRGPSQTVLGRLPAPPLRATQRSICSRRAQDYGQKARCCRAVIPPHPGHWDQRSAECRTAVVVETARCVACTPPQAIFPR
jgi:hypothetical protein